MAPAPPNVVSAGDAPRRDSSVNPNSLDSIQRAITRDSIPVRTRPFTGSSSPVRQQSIRPSAEKRKQLLNKNPYAPLATEDHGADDHFADAEVLIAEAQDQLDTRASILRAYSQAIAKCAEQFSSRYGKRFAQHLRTTLLQHWSAASLGEESPAPGHTATFGGTENASRTIVKLRGIDNLPIRTLPKTYAGLQDLQGNIDDILERLQLNTNVPHAKKRQQFKVFMGLRK